jgi:hypothetical protein
MLRILCAVLIALSLATPATAETEMEVLARILREQGKTVSMDRGLARDLGRGRKQIPVKSLAFKAPEGHTYVAAVDDTGEFFFVDYRSKKERLVFRVSDDGRLLSTVRVHRGRFYEEGKAYNDEFESVRDSILGKRTR